MKQRGKRIRPSGKDLVFHFTIASLLPVFLLVVGLFHVKTIQQINWQDFNLSQADKIDIPYLIISFSVAILICLLVDRKGVRNMKPSSFQTTIENQFDYICKRAMEDERKNYMLYLSRIAKREVSFSDVGDYLVSQFATTDNYSTDFQIFTLNGLSVGVENDLLSEALRELPDKKREILLLFYFMDMSDSEIADLLKLNRSTVYRHRTSGLALIKKFMEEFEE